MYSIERELNSTYNIQSIKINNFDSFRNNNILNTVTSEFLHNNIFLLRNIFSYPLLNLNLKAIPINQWIFWQHKNFNQWLTLEEEIEYMRSMIYDIYLTEDYSVNEMFDLVQYLLLELIKFELVNNNNNNNNTNEENNHGISEIYNNMNNEFNFSKLLLKLIYELINEAWIRLTSDDHFNIFNCLNYMNWLNNCINNLLKFNNISVNILLLLLLLLFFYICFIIIFIIFIFIIIIIIIKSLTIIYYYYLLLLLLI